MQNIITLCHPSLPGNNVSDGCLMIQGDAIRDVHADGSYFNIEVVSSQPPSFLPPFLLHLQSGKKHYSFLATNCAYVITRRATHFPINFPNVAPQIHTRAEPTDQPTDQPTTAHLAGRDGWAMSTHFGRSERVVVVLQVAPEEEGNRSFLQPSSTAPVQFKQSNFWPQNHFLSSGIASGTGICGVKCDGSIFIDRKGVFRGVIM